ncbi:MAG: hypothetical protein ACRENC_03755 [Gemmatimonadaceae bacterium]
MSRWLWIPPRVDPPWSAAKGEVMVARRDHRQGTGESSLWTPSGAIAPRVGSYDSYCANVPPFCTGRRRLTPRSTRPGERARIAGHASE